MLKRTIYLWFIVGLLLIAWTAGVGQAQSDRLQIVASTTIIADVASQVAGDVADVTSLMSPGADPHSYILAPRDFVALAEADVILVNGANFEEALLDSIASAGENVTIVEVSQCVEILPFGVSGEHEHEDDAHDEGHAHEGEMNAAMSAVAELCESHHAELETGLEGAEHDHGVEPLGALYALDCVGGVHEDEEGGNGHTHGEGSCDPHVWMDPHNVMHWTLTIRDTLIDFDPDNAETYTANTAIYVETLSVLVDEELMPLVESLPQEDRVLVTDHGSFGYFANAFGFEVVGVVIPGGSTVAEPSAAEIAALIDTIRDENVAAIFAGTTVNPALSERLASESGAAFYTLYTGSLSDADGPAATYVDFMRYDMQTIVGALRRDQ